MATPQLLSTTDQIALPTSLVLASRLGQVTFIPSTPPKGAGSNTLPVIQDGSRSMTPGQLYPSSGDPNQRLYLPAYQIATMTLVPALNGVGGTVNATLTAPVPQAASGQSAAIVPHVLRAQLVYALVNDKGNPTVTIRRDFDPVTTPGSPITLTIADAGNLGQVALALGKQKGTWGTTLVLTADMQIAIPTPRLIMVDKTALSEVMQIDPARLQLLSVARGLALTAPAASPAATPATADKLAMADKLAVADKVAAERAPLMLEKVAPMALASKQPPLRAAVVRTLPTQAAANPGLSVKPPFLHFPILNPPAPFPPPTGPQNLVTVPGEAVESLSLAAVTVEVPLTNVTLPTNTNLLQVPCDGIDLWVDQTVGTDFYYLPQSFRLSFVQVSGASVPTLLVTFDDGVTDPSVANTDLTMQLRPHMDPRDLGRAKAAAASFMAARGQSGQPRLAVQEPPITQLEWWVPSASGPDQSQVAAVPSASRAAFEQGLSAMLPMTYPQFQRVIDRFLVTWSPGLQGAVTYTSPEDPTLTQSVPIEVNLHDFEGDAVTVSIGSVGADGLTLTLTNVLSCDVQVDVVTMLEAGTSVTLVLHDETGAEIPSCAVAAGQALTVEVTGTGGASPAPADIGIVWHAMPTAEQLVGMCAGFIGTQLAKPAPVSLQVETLAGFFRPGVGPKRLTKLEVEFTGTDPPVKVELSAGATATANLTPPLLPALLNDPSALRFTYRVTNVYDDASTVVGPELAWDGGSPMIVEANPPEGQAHAAS